MFFAARSLLVISPNRGSRDYGIYVSWTLAALLIAIVLENELLPADGAALHYVIVPQLAALMGLHLWIWYRQEPWLVALGGAATTATIARGRRARAHDELARAGATGSRCSCSRRCSSFLWLKAVSTQARVREGELDLPSSKETLGRRGRAAEAVARPAAVGGAARGERARSASRTRCSAAAGSRRFRRSRWPPSRASCLLVTALVCAVPAASYWLTRKAWMPELTRFVWLAWIVVGFALTYGNYLSSLAQA